MSMIEEIKRALYTYVNKKIADIPYSLVKTAIVISSENTGYTIELDGEQYTSIPTLSSTSHSIGDTVKVLTTNDKVYNNIFILGKIKLT